MMQLHLPFLEMCILIPLLGAVCMLWVRNPATAQIQSIVFTSLAFLSSVGAWLDLYALKASEAHDLWDAFSSWFGPDFPVIDELSAPLLPLAALLYLLTAVATLRTKVRRFSFGGNLLSLSILLATLSCREPWILAILLIAGTLPALWELRTRNKPLRVYVIHMALMAVLVIAGVTMLTLREHDVRWQAWGTGLIALAILVRSGVFPFHCWLTDVFEHATFGAALLLGTPIVGAYLFVRMVLPWAPAWQLEMLGYAALVTAVYGGGMALVQREMRRFFCFLLISHTAIVLLGILIATPHSITGALCVWLSVTLALSGFGLTLRSIESRQGRLSLTDYHGLYEHMPTLAAFFLLTGLASIGFPGTFGFVGAEMLVDGVVQAYPYAGMGVVIAMTLSGIAVVKAYFLIFTGKRHLTTISLRRKTSERVAVLTLAVLIMGGGLLPQPGVSSRHHAATEILDRRQETLHDAPPVVARPADLPATRAPAELNVSLSL